MPRLCLRRCVALRCRSFASIAPAWTTDHLLCLRRSFHRFAVFPASGWSFQSRRRVSGESASVEVSGRPGILHHCWSFTDALSSPSCSAPANTSPVDDSLYVSKSSNTDRDAKNKNCDKIPGPRRSIRRRARLNDLNREASFRLRQRRAFIATHLNDRNSEEDGGPPRDRPLAVERVDLGPIRARSARTPGSYIASILDSIHSGPTGGVDPGRSYEAGAEPFTISDALDRAQSMANTSSMHDVSYLDLVLGGCFTHI